MSNELKNKIRALTPSQIPNFQDDIDFDEVEAKINEFIQEIAPRLNLQDIKDWRILINILYRVTDEIGVFKRITRYPSDKEFQLSISIPIPNESQAIYGLSKIKNYSLTPLTANFYSLKPNFEKYSTMEEFILKSSAAAISFAFENGVSCNGKKIRFN
ncbi:hypothetical protein HNP33_003637 [Comamonas odontotermitis]|uniref:Uncharacterized protein n=1 Tax=Comamonas odontotermitis TaxID=379895 RepID=A0ABR6RK28_9BURK|nr:Imm9 family immunity protein [Comamonas odontotermitis]MBB6579524.1 hypothetical protein [Comamonas odontotermitis]